MKTVNISKWGNSAALRLSKKIMDDSGLLIGDEVDVSVVNGEVIISKKKNSIADMTIEEIISKTSQDEVKYSLEINRGFTGRKGIL